MSICLDILSHYIKIVFRCPEFINLIMVIDAHNVFFLLACNYSH